MIHQLIPSIAKVITFQSVSVEGVYHSLKLLCSHLTLASDNLATKVTFKSTNYSQQYPTDIDTNETHIQSSTMDLH